MLAVSIPLFPLRSVVFGNHLPDATALALHGFGGLGTQIALRVADLLLSWLGRVRVVGNSKLGTRLGWLARDNTRVVPRRGTRLDGSIG